MGFITPQKAGCKDVFFRVLSTILLHKQAVLSWCDQFLHRSETEAHEPSVSGLLAASY